MMTERGVGAAVVIDEVMPAPGVISERDIINSIGRGENPDTERVGEHRSDGDLRSPGLEPRAAAMEMSRRHMHHLVVVERGELVGVLSIRDIVRVWTSEGATSSMTSPESEAASV